MTGTVADQSSRRARAAGLIRVADTLGPAGRLCRRLELHRPAKVNCLSLRMLQDLLAAVAGGRASRIILTGAGRSFCSGLDLKEIGRPGGAKRHLECLVDIYRLLVQTQAVTVALVSGCAAGGGAGLFACAQTVIASTDFRVLVPRGELAALASVVTPVLDLKAGGAAARGQAWVGCDLDVDGARRLGLVDRVVSPGHLDELVRKAGRGQLPPGCLAPSPREPRAVARALRGLENFLESFGRPSPKHGSSRESPCRRL
jgi:enoyl-CoA hydratase/carnithine racemase